MAAAAAPPISILLITNLRLDQRPSKPEKALFGPNVQQDRVSKRLLTKI
jgi:hypothetical protein